METRGKKALSLCVLRVLEQHASEKEPLSTRQIIEYLKQDFGMVAERKAVGRNLILLQEMGFGLSTYHDNGRGYYLTASANPELFDPVLYDALLRAPISEEGEKRIRTMQPDIPVYVVNETPQTLRLDVLDTLDVLRKAIQSQKQVTFLYHTSHTDNGMTSAPDAIYTISPYAVFLAEGRYYILASVSGYGRLLHFRCDYMRNIRLSDQAIRPYTELSECEDGLDIVGYVNRAIYHQDTAEHFILLSAGSVVDQLEETFGQEVRLTPEGDNIRVDLWAPWSSVRRFILNHLEQVTLLEPASRKKQIRDELVTALSVYPQH